MPPTQLSAVHPSPKRKRDNPQHLPLLNTTLRASSTPTPTGSPVLSGADSPRNAVADQLESMTIASLPPVPMIPLTPTDDAVRKKPKLEPVRVDSKMNLDKLSDMELESWDKERVRDGTAVERVESDPSRATTETPQSQIQVPQTQQPRTFADFVASTQPVVFASSSHGPPANQSITSDPSSKSKSGPQQPRSRKKSPSPPLSSLTWKDSEITGHLIDPSTDPDDDGTGINGIGFKPTPALAYARAQKRRQQVMDWRAREAREARAKRNQRRHRGVGGAGASSRETSRTREPAVKEAEEVINNRRIVRFAI